MTIDVAHLALTASLCLLLGFVIGFVVGVTPPPHK